MQRNVFSRPTLDKYEKYLRDEKLGKKMCKEKKVPACRESMFTVAEKSSVSSEVSVGAVDRSTCKLLDFDLTLRVFVDAGPRQWRI